MRVGNHRPMYLDSAIVVKLLVREQDSEFFNSELAGNALATSELGLVEVRSALFIKQRTGSITKNACTRAVQRFDRMIEEEALLLFPLDSRTIRRAGFIMEFCHPEVPLRSLDSLHVAACEVHGCEVLCTTDASMRSAGVRLALKLFPPSEDKAEI